MATRPPMPGFDPMRSLQSMLKMNTGTNVGALTDRGLDVATGMDQFEPSEQELIDAQLDAPTSRSGSFAQPSREQLREQAMSKVKQVLGMGEIEHGREMEGAALKGQIAADAQTRSNQMILDRQDRTAASSDARLDKSLAASDARQAALFAQQQALQEDRQAADALKPATSATTLPTEGMDKRLAEARAGYSGLHPMNSLQRMLGMTPSADTNYKGAIQTVMTRMNVPMELQGPIVEAAMAGMSGPQAIAEAESQGAVLDPASKNHILQILGQ